MYNFEQLGLIPRSIVRTFKRFIKQISLKTDLFAIYEFRISRYIAIASLQCFFLLIICPWIFQFFIKFFIIHFLFEYKALDGFLNQDIFINFNQQEHAFAQIQSFSEKLYFETLLDSFTILKNKDSIDFQTISSIPDSRLFSSPSFDFHLTESVQKIYQDYFLSCAHSYNKQSISIITNWIIDFTTLIFFSVLLISSTPQIMILKTFCIESLLSLSETTKCFFLIFFLDLLVGFHSSKSWEIFLQFFIEHFGFEFYPNPNFIAFFISTFPVFLDTIFKYWIFRYLNKISPSTVATYQAMIE
uniref:Envelope membrane protein n=1 Tax=Pseudochlorodesmis sp. HV01306a TaxID=2358488 RepID=A0A386AXW2_9CHLO|nr:Envelope membrane protein [Pseudochlorodesmis sp. HV01306a]